MSSLKTPDEIAILREGGTRHARVLTKLKLLCVPGTSLKDIDSRGREYIEEEGGEPAFFNYTPEGAPRPYPASVCVSVNEEIVHGIPNESDRVLEEGDIVSIDVGFLYKGLITDAAFTTGIGAVSTEARELIHATSTALSCGIREVKGGGAIGDIGAAIESFARTTPFSVAKHLAGHGVGYTVHEDPYVPNTGKRGSGEVMEPGLVIAIEPMLTMGSGDIRLEKDGFTYSTKEGGLSAHFEKTVVVTEKGCEVLTPFDL